MAMRLSCSAGAVIGQNHMMLFNPITVQDIKYMSEEDVSNQIKRDPKTCLRLKLDYDNIRVVMLDE